MISVIIPAHNEDKTIFKTLESLKKQNYPKNKYELIVVDDGSTDNTKNIVSSFHGVKLVSVSHAGPAAARNLGVKNSKGDILLFTDADCIPDKNWIKNMVEPFKDKKVVGISGTYKTLNKDSPIARFAGYEIEERHNQLKKQKNIDFIGTFSAGYRKNIFKKFGGFDEDFPTSSGEDPELSFKISKAGHKMVFQPKAFVYHNHPDTLWKFLKQKFWRGYWRVLVYRKHKDKIFKHGYTPKYLYLGILLSGMSIVFLALGVLSEIHRWRYLGISIIFAFLFTWLTEIPLIKKVFKKDKSVGLSSPLIIILRNFFTGAGIICGLLSFKKKHVR